MTEPTASVPAYETVVASTDEEIRQCYSLRIEVFHQEQKFPLDTEFDRCERRIQLVLAL